MAPRKDQRATGVVAARHLPSNSPFNALVTGTVVLTCDGALPVEYLTPGDRVITRDSGTAVLRAIIARQDLMRAVRIRAGTLGNMRPEADITLPASQEVLLRGWRAETLFGAKHALVPAYRLIDGTFVQDLGETSLRMIALVFDAPHILYAEGLEVASSAPATA